MLSFYIEIVKRS